MLPACTSPLTHESRVLPTKRLMCEQFPDWSGFFYFFYVFSPFDKVTGVLKKSSETVFFSFDCKSECLLLWCCIYVLRVQDVVKNVLVFIVYTLCRSSWRASGGFCWSTLTKPPGSLRWGTSEYCLMFVIVYVHSCIDLVLGFSISSINTFFFTLFCDTTLCSEWDGKLAHLTAYLTAEVILVATA